MSTTHAFGIDPGPTPGIVALHIDKGGLRSTDVVQCSADVAALILCALLEETGPKPVAYVGIERFVARGRASADQRLTAEQVTRLEREARDADAFVFLRSAAEVKPWATDERLEAAGLLAAVKGMRHAKDAARHALFAAVKGGHLPDPLSKDWKAW